MNVLLDTNIVLDVLLKRLDCREAAKIIALSEKGKLNAYVSVSAVTDIYFITHRELKSKKKAMELLRNLLNTVSIAALSGVEIHEALDLEWNDFEDSVQYTAGKAILAKYIISRNGDDFSSGSIPALTAEQFLDIVAPK